MECGITKEFLREFEPINEDDKATGCGTYSVVVVRRHKKSKILVAIKQIKKYLVFGNQINTKFTREISILKQLDHPFVSKFFGVVEDEEKLSIIMEYVPKGTLEDYIKQYGSLNNDVAQKFFVQLVACLDYLHKNHFMHRDLKPENILLDANYNIKLIDFGLSNTYSTQSPLKTRVGTPCYAAPEIFKNTKYTKAADIWSLGIVLYKMVTGILPFYSKEFQELSNKVCYDKLFIPNNVDSNCADLLIRMLKKDGNERIEINDIKKHPWVNQCKLSKIFYDETNNKPFSDSKYHIFQFNPNSVIDQEIKKKLDSFGYDTSQIENYIKNRDDNEIFATYKILKTEYVTNNLKDYLQELEKNPNKNTQHEITTFFNTFPYIKNQKFH